jgi:hypothetical protein
MDLPHEVFQIILGDRIRHHETLGKAGIQPFFMVNRDVVAMMLVCKSWFSAISSMRLGTSIVINENDNRRFDNLHRYNIVYLKLIQGCVPRIDVWPSIEYAGRIRRFSEELVRIFTKITDITKLEILDVIKIERLMNHNVANIISDMNILSLMLEMSDSYIQPKKLGHLYDNRANYLMCYENKCEATHLDVYVVGYLKYPALYTLSICNIDAKYYCSVRGTDDDLATCYPEDTYIIHRTNHIHSFAD